MYRAFQGANGWYVAWEADNGTHRQPANGGNLSRESAEKQAQRENRQQRAAERRREEELDC